MESIWFVYKYIHVHMYYMKVKRNSSFVTCHEYINTYFFLAYHWTLIKMLNSNMVGFFSCRGLFVQRN